MDLFNILLIETHNNCNRKCWFCKFGQERQDPAKSRMSMELIEKMAEELGRLDYRGRISPFAINEPLLDKRIFDIVALFRQKCPHAYISLITNGDLLDEEKYDKLVEAGIDGIGLSVYDDDAWVKLRPFYLRKCIDLIDMRQPEHFIENRGGEAKNLERNPEIDTGCGRPFRMLVVKPGGNTALCCSDMYGDVVTGDVATQSLQEIWEGEVFSHYRDKLETNRHGLKLCESCSYKGNVSPVRFPHKTHNIKVLLKEVKFYTPVWIKEALKKALPHKLVMLLR